MNKLKFKKNNLIKNYLYFFKLSLISLVISICILNLSLQFYETKRALLITLIILFFINFFNLKNYYSFQNNYIFFIYSILTRVFARIIEFYLFLFIFYLAYADNGNQYSNYQIYFSRDVPVECQLLSNEECR